MKRVFADTSYWIALLNPRNELHGRAVAVARSCAEDEIVTSEMVLVELLNGFSDGGPHLRVAGAKAVKTLGSSPSVTVIAQTSDLFRTALRRYEGRVDKDWSLTDCASFFIMEAEGIQAALTHDLHFFREGGARYELAKEGTLKLAPDPRVEEDLRSIMRKCGKCILAVSRTFTPSWPISANLKELLTRGIALPSSCLDHANRK